MGAREYFMIVIIINGVATLETTLGKSCKFPVAKISCLQYPETDIHSVLYWKNFRHNSELKARPWQ